MWIRVLGGKGPQKAGAAAKLTGQLSGQSQSQNIKSDILYVKLPRIDGRNDILSRDIFKADEKIWDKSVNTREGSQNSDEEVVKNIKQWLRLEAIELGDQPQAYINEQVLKTDENLVFEDEQRSYECRVIEITENTVRLRYQDFEIELNLIETSEKAN